MNDTPQAGRIELRHEGATAILTLSNPARRNAFTRDMRLDMLARLEELFLDDDVRAIVLTGAGEHFSAGADISNVGGDAAPWSLLKTRQNMAEVHMLVRAIVRGPKPVIAAVEGLAYGGGFAIVAACDQLVAARTARFGAAFAKLGLLGDMGLMWSLKERVGASRAKRIILLGKEMSGEEAGAIGLSDAVTEKGDALTVALAAAAEFVSVAPLSIAYTKAAYANGMDSIEDAFRAELDYVPILNRSEDFNAGIEAFRDKNAPRFRGR